MRITQRLMQKMAFHGSVAVYWNKKRKLFIVVPQVRDGFAEFGLAERTRIEEQGFNSVIISALLGALEVSRKAKYSTDIVSHHTAEEARTFNREHLCVGIVRDDGGNFIIRPNHRKGSGYVSMAGEEIVVKKDDHERIPAALREAFALS